MLEGLAEKKNIPLVSIGYIYSKKNVLTFIMMRGAGSIMQAWSYYIEFLRKYGNDCSSETT